MIKNTRYLNTNNNLSLFYQYPLENEINITSRRHIMKLIKTPHLSNFKFMQKIPNKKFISKLR